MMLIEQGTIAPEDLPVAIFRNHLRLGSGFTDDTLQDSVLDGFLRAAMAAVEARTGKALLERAFLWTVTQRGSGAGLDLPVAPVSAIERVSVIDAGGAQVDVAAQSYRLRVDTHAPCIVPLNGEMPGLPQGGVIEIVFLAGFGPEWSDVPEDLAQAVIMLASHYYEFRNDTGLGAGCMPFGVSSLIERHRKVRIGMGGGA